MGNKRIHSPLSKGRPPPPYWIFFIIVLAAVTQPISCECDTGVCWDLYQQAKEHLGVQDEFPVFGSRQPPLSASADTGASCLAIRTFYLCLGNMTLRCRSDLGFHTAYKGMERQLKNLKCNKTGAVFDPEDAKNSQDIGPQYNTVCTYKQTVDPLPYYHCSLFGDPHLRTFTGSYETCRLKDVWSLLDNEYLTVQVTNTAVGVLSQTSTAITEITAVVKAHSKCAEKNFVTYEASAGDLPEVFSTGYTYVGKEHAVTLTTIVPRQHVEIYVRYIDTTIILRLVGRYYSIAVKMPQEVVNSTIYYNNGEQLPDDEQLLPSPIQLCAFGCPDNQKILYQDIIAHAQVSSSTSSQQLTTSSLYQTVMSKHTALEHCGKAGLVDYYLDSCVFDLMSTGDNNFTLTSLYAYNDSLRMIPELAASYQNRTFLDLKEASANSGSSHSSGLSVHCYHYSSHINSHSVYSIARKSHLNYIHKTTYVLLLGIMVQLVLVQFSSCVAIS